MSPTLLRDRRGRVSNASAARSSAADPAGDRARPSVAGDDGDPHVRPHRPAAGRGPGRRRRPRGCGGRRGCRSGGPSATIRPRCITTMRGKKCAASARSWRTATIVRAVALVEVDEQLHDVDLVPDVQVGGRLVEDEDRRGLGEGDRDEDELSLAHRELAAVAVPEVADADPVDRRRDGRPVDGTRAAQRRLVGQPAEGHDVVDAHLERQLGELRDDRDRPGDGPAVERARAAAPRGGSRRSAARGRRSGRAAGSTCRRRSGRPAPAARRAPIERSTLDEDRAVAVGDGQPDRATGSVRRSQLVPGTRAGEQEQEERARR